MSVGILDDEKTESHFSVLGESSASLYKNKKFEYTTPEGCEYKFSVNPDGVSVTLEKGQARNVDVLIIPNGVNGLGPYFFVTAIGDFAFCAHTMLGRRDGEIHPMDGVKKLIIPKGIEYVGQNCFENAEDLEEVVIPSSLGNLGYCMFTNCEKLKSVYIPEDSKLISIEDFVFMDCYALDSFYIPQSVQEIKQGPWRNCKSLEKLVIADNNYNFHVYDGVLYNRDRKHLIQYPAGKKDQEYYVGFGTQAIDNSAFYGNEYLSTVTFPASLDSISHIAFYGCSNLENVVFNDVIEFIGNSVFEKCPKLKQIQLYGNPTYTYDGLYDPYNTFEPYTRVNIEKGAPPPELAKSKGSIFDRIYLTVSKLPYFSEMEIPNNEDYGFPQYLGKGKAVVYGNAEPKEDILRLLSLIPMKSLAYEETDEKGRITRYYVDYGKKQALYFFGGIGGNDLVVALFKSGEKKKIMQFMKSKNNK
ncbi:MAG: leucine-rich repeat domain-containing protein [Muribaculum sp.]|nr:leucine-rich repeat domain-containing protein [Muribaculum sp.]